MAKIAFGTELRIPDDLVQVAVVTGNGILDVGYQCSDSHPYFQFGEYYTKVNPKWASSATSVFVYKYSSVADRMVMQGGMGSQNGSTLTYNGTSYSYSSAYRDMREYNINKWAADKPLNIDQNNTLTEAQKTNANRGLSVTSYTTLGALLTAVKNAEDGEKLWTYTPPPVSGCRKRLRDFHGYNHLAQNPLKYELDYTSAYTGDTVVIAKEQYLEEMDNITPEDLSFMANKYIGVVFRKQDDSTKLFAKTMQSGDYTIEVPISVATLVPGKWDVAMMASSVELDFSSSGTPNGTFIPLPSRFATLEVKTGTGITYKGTSAKVTNDRLTFNLSIIRQRPLSVGYFNVVYKPTGTGSASWITQSLDISSVPASGLFVSLNLGSYASNWRMNGDLVCVYVAGGMEQTDNIETSIYSDIDGLVPMP